MKLDVTGTDSVAMITPRGDFLGYDGEVLRETLSDIRANGIRNVVLDLGHSTHVDTSAVGVILGEARTHRALGGDLRVAGVEANARIFNLVTLTRLSETLACFETAGQAIHSFEIVDGPLAFA